MFHVSSNDLFAIKTKWSWAHQTPDLVFPNIKRLVENRTLWYANMAGNSPSCCWMIFPANLHGVATFLPITAVKLWRIWDDSSTCSHDTHRKKTPYRWKGEYNSSKSITPSHYWSNRQHFVSIWWNDMKWQHITNHNKPILSSSPTFFFRRVLGRHTREKMTFLEGTKHWRRRGGFTRRAEGSGHVPQEVGHEGEINLLYLGEAPVNHGTPWDFGWKITWKLWVGHEIEWK